MPARLTILTDPNPLHSTDALLLIGRAERLLAPDIIALIAPHLDEHTWRTMVKRSDPSDNGRVATHWTGGSPARISAGVLPEVCSRHNSPSRAWAIPHIVRSAGQKGNVGIVLATEAGDHCTAALLGVARALPTFASTSTTVDREVRIFLRPKTGSAPDPEHLRIVADAARMAAHLTDQPPNVLGCDAFVERAHQVAVNVGATIHVLRAPELREQGLGGIAGVGQAAEQQPALVVLDHAGQEGPSTAWIGKGIVYDTGGLSIKTKTGMPGMKTDMAGAAAVLSAFGAAVRLGHPRRLTAVLCIAENAVGPGAIRPDDVLKLYSGRTVEVNNTDAEGRLVLSDGIAWAARNRTPDEIVDMATLTGAQAVATGKRHAALYCSDEALERRAIEAGRRMGELVHALPYCPEFYRREFSSSVADMRNSVKDRSNAQSSCAGQFIGNHLAATGFDGAWLHVDMAAPAVSGQRGTGFGVGLLLALLGLPI